MAENRKPKEHLSWWYFLAKYVMLFFFKILHPYRIIGRENMPLTGKLLVCSNHVTMGDPIYLGCAIPKRQLHYMAKTELFENKLIGGFLKSLGAFPISRGTGGAQGIQTAIDSMLYLPARSYSLLPGSHSIYALPFSLSLYSV